jgi:uncharacterized protein
MRPTGRNSRGGPVSVALEDIIEALSDPTLYPHAPASVDVVQTHISVVFLAGDVVYKVKKPVNLGFLDFSSPEKRKHFCRREVALNSRFSHDIYLGVAHLYLGPSGINLDGAGQEVDSAVVMRRVPSDRFMTAMLEKDLITPAILDGVADRLAYFHSLAARGSDIARFGDVQVIYGNVKENFDQTRPFVGRIIDGDILEETAARATDFLYLHEHLFEDRVRGGFIRDCHGDLHLDHVVILNGIMFCDCIEFNDRFRYGDTASDLGFLLMDLDFWGFPAFSARIRDRYTAYSGDEDIVKLLGFYESYRAFVRGKVSALALDEPEILETDKMRLEQTARDSFRFALSYLKPPPRPVVIVMTGLMGAGKSHLAEGLGKRLGIGPLRSDVLRKRIHGLSIHEHQLDKFGQGVYTAMATERTYEALLKGARRALNRGESVILDASFMRYQHRAAARDLARNAEARFRLVHCIASDDILRDRLAVRLLQKHEPSDGRWEILCDQRARFEDIRPEEQSDLRVWDSRTDANPFLMSLVRELLAT